MKKLLALLVGCNDEIQRQPPQATKTDTVYVEVPGKLVKMETIVQDSSLLGVSVKVMIGDKVSEFSPLTTVEMWCDGEYNGDIAGCLKRGRKPEDTNTQGDVYIRLHRDWNLLKVPRN